MNNIVCPHCGKEFTLDETAYNSIANQVRNEQFFAELHERETIFEDQKKSAVLLAKKEAESKLKSELSQMESQIAVLKQQLSQKDTERELAVERATNKNIEEMNVLKNALENEKSHSKLELKNAEDKYKGLLQLKDEQIEQYKDMKLKLSTKMVGETLERHCENQFNLVRMAAFKNAYFEKDNDVSGGSKGDYIFRDYTDDGLEYVSIMFEMKNQNEQTATKHKNEDFFDKLDKDRRAKKCEYAVLVSLLEEDSELYNAGIVDVSHKYEKMYVIRPQFFVPMITLIRNAALNNVSTKRELEAAKNQNLDIMKFEADLNEYKARFARNCRLSNDKFTSAIAEIDSAIKKLQQTKEDLISSANNLRLAEDKLNDITVKRLLKNNPTMALRYESTKKEESDHD